MTSEVYNKADLIFSMLQNKEKLISFLDCTTLLRGMGMNPTLEEMDALKERMAEPIVKLEQWRREEELRRDKERRKEEAKQRKKSGARKSTISQKKDDKAVVEEKKATKIIPVDEIKNIDWNIFITCAEEMYRDSSTEEKQVLAALEVFEGNDPNALIQRDRLLELVTCNGDNILTPAEAKQLRELLPEECSLAELAARIQGTYKPPTQEELDRIAAEAFAEKKRKEEAEKAALAANADPLAGL